MPSTSVEDDALRFVRWTEAGDDIPVLAPSVVRRAGGPGDRAMSKHLAHVGKVVVATLHDSMCRQIRITDERIRLARGIEIAAKARPDALSVVPKGLEDIPSYRRLADEGLAHATLRRAEGSVIVLAATNRVWRRPELRRLLLAVKRDARRLGRRVVLVTKRGLARSTGDRLGHVAGSTQRRSE